MLGNVMEWTMDHYEPNGYASLAGTDPIVAFNAKKYPKGKEYCVMVTPDSTFEKGFDKDEKHYFPEKLVSHVYLAQTNPLTAGAVR